MHRKYDIYVSYSRSNYVYVNKVVQELQIQGFTIWMDVDSIVSNAMCEVIENACVLLFFSSTESNQSSRVQNDLCTAIDLGKPIITIRLDDSNYNQSYAKALSNCEFGKVNDEQYVKKLGSVIDKTIKEEYSWVFISHSTLDFEIVRLVRNALEKRERRPILFFLKCLSQKEEVSSLLKREIDARHRFILCDSKNARASEYVQEEVDYIQSKKRMYETIDLSQINLNSPTIEQDILNLIKPFERRTSVFLSYSRDDQFLASQLKKQLNRVGFDVWDADFYFNQMPGVATDPDWSSLIKTSIKETLDDGYFIALLGDRLGEYSMDEIKFAYEVDPSRVLPVALSTIVHPDFLQKYNMLDVSNERTDLDKAKAITEELISLDNANSK